jgi:hypothetical protein
LVSKAPSAVTISCEQYHNFSAILGSAQEVAVLQRLYSFTRFMSQNSQSFLGYFSHACLKHPPWSGSLDHLVDVVDTKGCRPLIDDHMHMLKVRVSVKQPRGFDE